MEDAKIRQANELGKLERVLGGGQVICIVSLHSPFAPTNVNSDLDLAPKLASKPQIVHLPKSLLWQLWTKCGLHQEGLLSIKNKVYQQD